MKTADHERRDRSLLMFIVPIGILLMFIVGHFAIRMLPRWSLNVGMQSSLNPETASTRPVSIFQPILQDILTPMVWTYLTPGDDVVFPPFIIVEPGATRTPTPVLPTPTFPPSVNTATTTPIPPASTNTLFPTFPIPTRTHTPTNIPPVNTSTQAFTATPTLPLTNTATITATATPEIIVQPTATPTGFPSTPPGTRIDPPPTEIGIGPPDGEIGVVREGQYTVIDLGSTPIIVKGPGVTNSNYDLVYYEAEYEEGGVPMGYIYMDVVAVGISHYPDGREYYVVFYWDDNNTFNANTNIGYLPSSDNLQIPLQDLYPYTDPPTGTGILIDVDNASSFPPPGSYRYLVIASLKPIGSADTMEVDSVELVDIMR
ncbi:MAG: hypothetical protein KJZ77_03650 [Anaerolineales bacterium]|nr:hypothetical protein [Anaerolineales bacterium]